MHSNCRAAQPELSAGTRIAACLCTQGARLQLRPLKTCRGVVLEALSRFPEAITDYQAVSAANSGPCCFQPLQLYKAGDAAGWWLKDIGVAAMPLVYTGVAAAHVTEEGTVLHLATAAPCSAVRGQPIVASTSPCASHLISGHSGAGEAASGSSSLEQSGERHSRWGQQSCSPSWAP